MKRLIRLEANRRQQENAMSMLFLLLVSLFPIVFPLTFGDAAFSLPAVFGTILGTKAVAPLPRLTGAGSIRSIVHSRRDVAEWRHPLPVRAPGPDVVAIWPHGRPRPAGQRTGWE